MFFLKSSFVNAPVVDLLVARRTSTQRFALRIVNNLPVCAWRRLREDSPVDQWLVVVRVWPDIHGRVVRSVRLSVYEFEW